MADGLGPIVMEALAMRDAMKRSGMKEPELSRGLESLLRDTWPKPAGRETPWRDNCANCRDYGLEMRQCPGDATCGLGKGRPHYPHEYGVPWWCPLGKRFQEKTRQTEEDAATLAARPKKPVRWGR